MIGIVVLHLYYFWLNVCLNLLISTIVLNFICFLKYLVLLVFISKWLFQLVLTPKNTKERVRKVLLFVFCLQLTLMNKKLWILIMEKPLFQHLKITMRTFGGCVPYNDPYFINVLLSVYFVISYSKIRGLVSNWNYFPFDIGANQ